MLKRIVLVVALLVVLAGGGVVYVLRHPTAVMSLVVEHAGPRVVSALLAHHPVPLMVAAHSPAIPLHVNSHIGNQTFARAIGSALADQMPTHFAITKQDLGQLPVAAQPLVSTFAGVAGQVTGMSVQQVTGTTRQATATVSATVTLNGQSYTATGTVTVTNGAITGASGLQLTPQ